MDLCRLACLALLLLASMPALAELVVLTCSATDQDDRGRRTTFRGTFHIDTDTGRYEASTSGGQWSGRATFNDRAYLLHDLEGPPGIRYQVDRYTGDWAVCTSNCAHVALGNSICTRQERRL